MNMVHEGEILLKEKYGSISKERYYIKPPEQANIIVLDEENTSNVTNWFTKLFLPQGYPDSVSQDYVAYQIWDTAQAFCSTITGILATQEVLRGVGVGDNTATPLAATVTWVVKDGFGHLGKILFAFTHGTYLDAYSKKWRLCADTLNDAAMCIELALPLFKSYTTIVLCVSTVMKAVVGVAGGATRAAMTQHHALRGNMADVTAKDSAQETAVNLVASITTLFIITVFGSSIFIFLLMIMLHITFNYFAVRAVCLRTLNEPRFLQQIDLYLKKEIVANTSEINKNEPIFFYQLGPHMLDTKVCGFQIKLGHSLKNITKDNPNAIYLKHIKEVYEDRHYMLIPNVRKKIMYVMIKENASTDDMLCAYFHAVLLSIITCTINDEPLAIFENTVNQRPFTPFIQLCLTLQSVEWSREETDGGAYGGFTYEPSYDLIQYFNKVAQKEWNKARNGLITLDWDLSKHLLIADEWRISDSKLSARRISAEESAINYGIRRDSGSRMGSFQNVFDDIHPDEQVRRERDEFTIEPDVSAYTINNNPRLITPDTNRSTDPRSYQSSVNPGDGRDQKKKV